MALLRRLKGYPGHPSHAPLTGVSIGAYTVAVALLVLGALGLEEPAMARVALLATSAGLILTPPTVLTGLLDWRDLPPRTPKRTLANLHLGTMLAAAAIFALSWFPGRAGYHDGRIHAAALILALAGEALLLAGATWAARWSTSTATACSPSPRHQSARRCDQGVSASNRNRSNQLQPGRGNPRLRQGTARPLAEPDVPPRGLAQA